MYSCYDPFVVFGIQESNRDMMLDSEWLAEHFPNIQMWASDIVRNCMGSAIYGYAVYLQRETGMSTVSDEEKADVEALYERMCAHYRAQGVSEEDMPEMGYFLAMSGDYECEHSSYVPNAPELAEQSN
jgi:hypothetical protein